MFVSNNALNGTTAGKGGQPILEGQHEKDASLFHLWE